MYLWIMYIVGFDYRNFYTVIAFEHKFDYFFSRLIELRSSEELYFQFLVSSRRYGLLTLGPAHTCSKLSMCCVAVVSLKQSASIDKSATH